METELLWIDYVVFTLMLIFSTSTGIYYGFFKNQSSAFEYLLGGEKMNVWPIALSITSSAIAAIPMLLYPTEIYRFGPYTALLVPEIVVIVLIVNYIYIPIFYKLQVTSVYEYFEIRFNRKIRLLASVFNTLHMIVCIPLAGYIPSIVLSQATGLSTTVYSAVICCICTFYTAAGGIKAVIWTDVLQLCFMSCAVFLLVVIGVIRVGGLDVVYQKALEGGRLRLNFDFDVTRDTFWSGGIGMGFFWLYMFGLNQSTVQKCMVLRSAVKGKRAIFIAGSLLFCIFSLIFFNGFVIFAKYSDCDPLMSQKITKPDHLVTFYALDINKNLPGFSGMFIAGIVSAGLSTMSSMTNCLVTTLYEDFIKAHMRKNVSDKIVSVLLKSMVVICGVLMLTLIYVYEGMGNILPLANTLGGSPTGVILGIFTAGMMIPFVNSLGILIGGVLSLCLMVWISLSNQIYRSAHPNLYPHLSTSIDGCSENIANVTQTYMLWHNSSDAFILNRIHHLYLPVIGFLLVITTSVIASVFTKGKKETLRKDCIVPFLHFLLPNTDDYRLVHRNENQNNEIGEPNASKI